jgi:hypothetical protein
VKFYTFSKDLLLVRQGEINRVVISWCFVYNRVRIDLWLGSKSKRNIFVHETCAYI